MVTPAEVFETYRDWSRRRLQTRCAPGRTTEYRMGQKVWHNSPINSFKNFTSYRGKFMAEIPAAQRLQGVNPHLIDKLQEIWDLRTTVEHRLKLLDMLEQNLGADRPRLLGNLMDDRLVTFKGDPADGSPLKAAP